MTVTTEHLTGVGEIKFMAVGRPLTNQKSGKSEYSIKLRLPEGDSSIAHLSEIADYKVDTKSNRKNLAGDGHKFINFASDYAPKIMDSDGNVLEGDDIPFFDSREDTGTAVVSYKVIDFGDNKIVRLGGVKLMQLNLTEKEGKESVDSTLELLKTI